MRILAILGVVLLASTTAYADNHEVGGSSKISFGLEAGYASAKTGSANSALAQSLADSTGRTVTVTYKQTTYAGRLFGLYELNEKLDVEVGYMNTGSLDSDFSFSGTTTTMAIGLKANGFDAGVRFKPNSDVFLKLGVHNYDLDAKGTVTISGTSYSATSTDNETKPYYGVGYNLNETTSIGVTIYTKVGGSDGGDVSFVYAGYKF